MTCYNRLQLSNVTLSCSLKIETNVRTNVSLFSFNLWHTDFIDHHTSSRRRDRACPVRLTENGFGGSSSNKSSCGFYFYAEFLDSHFQRIQRSEGKSSTQHLLSLTHYSLLITVFVFYSVLCTLHAVLVGVVSPPPTPPTLIDFVIFHSALCTLYMNLFSSPHPMGWFRSLRRRGRAPLCRCSRLWSSGAPPH